MALHHSPSIVTNGLLLYLDVINIKSYPGTGTTWSDISGNGRNATLTNAPTYSSSGYFTFNGLSNAVDVSTFPSIANNFTINLWCTPTTTHGIDSQSTSGTAGTSGQKYIIGATHSGTNGGAGVSVGTNGVSVYEHGDNYMPALLVYQTTISSTQCTNIVIVYTNKQPSVYINGNFGKTGLTSPKTNVYSGGYQIGYGAYGYFQGNLFSASFYNRSLSAIEIKQNFNALRGRYDI